jgi:hypothetical protein
VRRKIKKFRVLIFGLSILMSVCLVYPKYDGLGEIHFLSSNLTLVNFGDVDQEDLAIDPPTKSKGIVSYSFVNLHYLGIHSFKNFFPFPFPLFFFEQESFILRC